MAKKDKKVVVESLAKSKKNIWRIGLVILIIMGLGVYTTFEREEYRGIPTTTTVYNFSHAPPTTYPALEMDDTFFLGYDYQNEYSMHTATLGLQAQTYNHERVNYVYVSNGYINFYLKANGSGVLKILSINLNPLGCRENRVYADGVFIGYVFNLERDDILQASTAWDVLNVTATGGKLRVTISHDEQSSECRWGHDINQVRFMPMDAYLQELKGYENPDIVVGEDDIPKWVLFQP